MYLRAFGKDFPKSAVNLALGIVIDLKSSSKISKINIRKIETIVVNQKHDFSKTENE